jgi:hypothetical protein
MKEHTGCLDTGDYDEGLSNVFSEDFDKSWLEVASNNTEIYRDVFRCLPDDGGKGFHIHIVKLEIEG